MKVRIVLLPEERLKKLSEEYSARLNNKLPCLFKLDRLNIVHATILHLEFKDEVFNEVAKVVEEVAKETKPIKMKTEKVVRGGDPGYIGIRLSKNLIFNKIRRKLLDKLDGLVDMFGDIRPAHITLTRLISFEDDPKNLEYISDFPREESNFKELAICQAGPNGTCTRILASFSPE